jgi:AcrR family transcriptional regulator
MPTARRVSRQAPNAGGKRSACGGAAGGKPTLAHPTPPMRSATDRGGGRDGVAEIQRARVIAAMVEVVAERGVARTTVAHVVARSGVSRRTFYELFSDREDCFLAAFEQAVERAVARVVPAFEEGEGWLDGVRAGLRALLEFLDDEPGLGRLAVVDTLGGGPVALARRRWVVGGLIGVVDRGRQEPRALGGLTRLTAEGVVGAVLAVLHARLTDSGPAAMVGLLGPLMGMVVLPYRGRAIAAREMRRPVARRRRTPAPVADPLRGLDMRLTYRTVRVLAAVAGVPGASNREVAQAAGVSDQGQISKLLVRLEHLGLLTNAGGGHARGEPNAWRLTTRGEEVQRTISHQTQPTTS